MTKDIDIANDTKRSNHPARSEPGCAYCFASKIRSSSYKIRWNETSREFQIAMSLVRDHQNQLQNKIIEQLPHEISKNSYCSCGAALHVGEYTVHATKESVNFGGKFYCPKCTDKGKSSGDLIKISIKEFWSQLSKVKVGPGGIEVEKK